MNTILNMNEFNEIIKKDIVIVLAKTHLCNVCKPISDKLIEFMEEYPNIPYYQIYGDDVEEFSGQNLVFTVPTILIFSNNKEILRESRFINFNNIKRLIDIYLS